MKKYAIVCGSRTGSTYLCDLLSSTNRCGRPQEFLNPSMNFNPSRHWWIKNYKTENDVFGIKIVGFPQIELYLNSGLIVDRHIWLYREDSVLQAISRYIAFTTNGWHKKRELPEYSYEGIQWCLDEIDKENSYLEQYFEDKDYLKLSYETDVCDNPEQTVVSVLQYLNISTYELPRIKSVKQTTEEVNNKWRLRFNEELRNRGQDPRSEDLH